MFESVHRRGNGLFLDNISLTELVSAPDDAYVSDGFRVYPNPTNGSFVLETSTPLQGGSLRIFSPDSSLFSVKRLSPGSLWTINQPGLTSGIYILQLITDKQVRTMKLVIK